jgi:hypothetical protein
MAVPVAGSRFPGLAELRGPSIRGRHRRVQAGAGLQGQGAEPWLQSMRLEGARVIKEPPELLTRNGVSYEMAFAARSSVSRRSLVPGWVG